MKKWFLKRKLKIIYKKLIYDFENYDCGHTLLCTISADYYNLCLKFNVTADKLSKIDDNCPKFKYTLN